MKKLNLIIAYSIVSFLVMGTKNSLAQDTLFMRNNQHIACQVMEVGLTEVKYKKLEMGDGPLYVEEKSLILKIKYKNGFTDEFPELKTDKPLNSATEYSNKAQKKYPNLNYLGNLYVYGEQPFREEQMQNILLALNNPKITKQIKGARISKVLKKIGFLAIPFGVAGLVNYMSAYPSLFFKPDDYERKTRNGNILFSCAAIPLTASLYFKINQKQKNRSAIRLYQQQYSKQY